VSACKKIGVVGREGKKKKKKKNQKKPSCPSNHIATSAIVPGGSRDSSFQGGENAVIITGKKEADLCPCLGVISAGGSWQGEKFCRSSGG